MSSGFEFTTEKFNKVIEDAVNIMQQKGCFTLKDAVNIESALKDIEKNKKPLIDIIKLGQSRSPFTFNDAAILHAFLTDYEKKEENQEKQSE